MLKSSASGKGNRNTVSVPDSVITRSSGNVFEDLGFAREEARNLALRVDLMFSIEQLIERRKLTQSQAARLFGVTQPRISDLMRGKLDLFSIDTLIMMLGRAGIGVSFALHPQAA